jgi:hypothetical protein
MSEPTGRAAVADGYLQAVEGVTATVLLGRGGRRCYRRRSTRRAVRRAVRRATLRDPNIVTSKWSW